MTITQLPNGFVFVPRADWTSSPLPTATIHTPVDIIRIHHTVTPVTNDPCADFRTVQRALKGRGLDGYNYLAHPSGVIGELCGTRKGEHTKGHNDDSYAFSLVGNYESQMPTLLQLVNISRAINLLILDGKVRPFPHLQIVPHRATSQTACPGRNIVTPINGHTSLDWISLFVATGA